MHSWRNAALVGAFAMGVVACGGGEPDMDVTTEQPAAEAPAAEAPAAETPVVPANLPEGVTAEMVAQGEQLFKGNGLCHTCHGPNATGTPLAPNLTDDTWLNISGRNYDEIVQLVTTGVPSPVEAPSPMPAMGGASLTEDQVHAVAAYVATLGQS